MDKLDEFLERTGIELLPFQKEVLRHVVNGERCYFIFPYRHGREFFQGLLYSLPLLLKGENKNV